MTTTARNPGADRAIGPLTLDQPQRGAATENDKAGEACDDHGEPKHHGPGQSLLSRHSTVILSCEGSTVGGLSLYACSPNASEQSVPYGLRMASAGTILAAEGDQALRALACTAGILSPARPVLTAPLSGRPRHG